MHFLATPAIHMHPGGRAGGFARDAGAAPEWSRLAALRRDLTTAFHLPAEKPRGPYPRRPGRAAG